MPAFQYWFTGSAAAAFIAFATSFLVTGFAWYRAAVEAEHQEVDHVLAERDNVLAILRNEYILSHDGISPGLMAGTESPPKDWINKRLKELGKDWRI